MHIRLNIPNWGWREITRGLAVMASGGNTQRYRQRLRLALEREMPGWTPVLLSSARYGLTLAVKQLGFEGKRIAVPGYVCPALLTGLQAAGVRLVPIDCLPGSIRFDPELLTQAAIEGAIDAVLAANTYGLDQDYAKLAKLGFPVIEDAAYQTGRTESGGSRLCGTRGDTGVWSFNFKALAGVGGGVLLVRDQTSIINDGRVKGDVREALRFVNYAARSLGRQYIPRFIPGTEAPSLEPETALRAALLEMRKSAMSELQAAVALAQWESRERLELVQQHNSQYLANALALCDAFVPLLFQENEIMVHLFPFLVRVASDEAPAAVFQIRRFLHSRGVQTETPYPILLGSPRDLPAAHDLAARIILVPCNAALGENEIKLIATALQEVSRKVVSEFKLTSEVPVGSVCW